MTPTALVEPHPAAVDAYLRHGWALVPIPPRSKAPIAAGWNERTAVLRSAADLPPGWNLGLAHAYSGTCAIDIDDYAASKIALGFVGVDLDALFAAPDAVTIDSGRPGHAKLMYATPLGLALPSKKVTAARQAVYDLRCATANGLTVQDVLPPSIHPDTGQPYQWGGAGHWQRLPVLPLPLLELWQSLLTEPEAPPPPERTDSADWAEIASAVNAIDPSCSRDEWIAVGMALHREDPERGLELWTQWSKKSPKYPGERAIATQWKSFRDDKATVVTLGTLFKLATEAGWERPPPNVTALFKPITAAPIDVKALLRTPPPTMNMDLWPPVLRERALKIAASTSCDPLVPLWAGLAAAAGAADAQSRLELMPGWQVPPILWLCTVGDPAQRKTPGSQPMRKVLVEIEQEDRPRFAKAMLDWEMRQAIWAAQKKDSLEWAKSSDARLGGAQPQLQEEPWAPVAMRIVVSDITSQKLVRHCADLPRGLLCWLDEMKSWCDKLVDPRSGEHRSTWTEAYEGNQYTLDRVGAGSITATNFALSIFGNIQPMIFRQHIKSLGADGFIQRFVPAVLENGKRELNDPMPDEHSGRIEWDNAVRCIHALPALTYTLHPDAFILWREWQRWAIQRNWDDTLLGRGHYYQTAMGKIEGTVARFAFVMHLLENPFSTVIGASTIERAIELGKTYIVPVLHYVYGEMTGQSAIESWISDYVIQHADAGGLTLQQIKRSARRPLEDIPSPWVQDQLVISAMLTMEEAGWVARTDDGSEEQRHRATWAINPLLITKFAEHRREVAAAKQRAIDYIYERAKGPRRLVYGFEPE